MFGSILDRGNPDALNQEGRVSMKKELLLTVSATAMAFVLAGPVTAAQPTNIDLIRCSNNGNGNGGEGVVTFGDPPTTTDCLKNQNNGEDGSNGNPNKPGDDPTDPQNTGP
jgi:hypothetical protein